MSDDERQILVCNTGSSSLKVSLFAWDSLESRGTAQTTWHPREGSAHQEHGAQLTRLLNQLAAGRIVAAGHRVVHGGAALRESVLVDARVKRLIADVVPLAPLHNPAALSVIEAVERAFPDLPQVAAFDTAFHATMPPAAKLYPVPYAWYEEWGIQRFGFHGLSHAYCASRAAELLARPLAELKLVTCHLGQGASLAAIAGGRSIATTMGFTPLDGLMMGTRSGVVDPGILLYLLRSGRLDPAALEAALSYESGLKGVSGISDDMRQILAARQEGDERAILAFDLYIARLTAEIAAMAAALGGVDSLVFTAGIGEHAVAVRTAACSSLSWLGVRLDPAANVAVDPDCDIAATGSAVRVLVIQTREDLMVARETQRIMNRAV